MNQRPGETRLHFLARVAARHIEQHAYCEASTYDEATHTGSQLARELRHEVEREEDAATGYIPPTPDLDPEKEHCKV